MTIPSAHGRLLVPGCRKLVVGMGVAIGTTWLIASPAHADLLPLDLLKPPTTEPPTTTTEAPAPPTTEAPPTTTEAPPSTTEAPTTTTEPVTTQAPTTTVSVTTTQAPATSQVPTTTRPTSTTQAPSTSAASTTLAPAGQLPKFTTTTSPLAPAPGGVSTGTTVPIVGQSAGSAGSPADPAATGVARPSSIGGPPPLVMKQQAAFEDGVVFAGAGDLSGEARDPARGAEQRTGRGPTRGQPPAAGIADAGEEEAAVAADRPAAPADTERRSDGSFDDEGQSSLLTPAVPVALLAGGTAGVSLLAARLLRRWSNRKPPEPSTATVRITRRHG